MPRSVVLSGALIATFMSLLCLALPTPNPSANCDVPSMPSTYYLAEGLDDNGAQPFYTTYVVPLWNPPQVVPLTGFSVQPVCMGNYKAMSMYKDDWYIPLFTETLGGTGFQAVKVMTACNGSVVFNIVHHEDAFTYSITDVNGDCIGFVRESSTNEVKVLNCTDNSVVLAKAHKSFYDQSVTTPVKTYPSSAAWFVEVMSPTLVSSSVPFLLTIKDNQMMDCVATASPSPAAPESGLGSGSVIVIAVLVSGFVAFGIYMVMRRYHKRADYAEMRQSMNDVQE